MSENSEGSSTDINIIETLAALWAHKFLIVTLTVIVLALSFFRASNEQTVYTAKAIFNIQSNEKSNFNMGSDFGLIASIAGISPNRTSEIDILLEKISSREFILTMSQRLQLKDDNFFNPEINVPQNSKWSFLLNNDWISLRNQTPNVVDIKNKKQRIETQNIINNYKLRVKSQKETSGLISLEVTHVDPNLAASYTNKLMKEIKNTVELEMEDVSNQRLTYLSQTLADALQEMEAAQEELKNFALQNNSAAPETFLAGTIVLDLLRVELKEAKQISEVLDAVKKILVENDKSQLAYSALRQEYPMIDNYKFRRILGMSETISAWRWPELSTIETVKLTLSDRIQRLKVEIANKEDEAKMYASSAEELEKLKRNAKIAEATYTVLIEQVKSQSLSAGFRPDTFQVFEYATPPLSPSAPNKKAMLLFGGVAGILLGTLAAFLNSIRRSVYYTKKSLRADTDCEISINSKPFRHLTNKSFTATEKFLRGRSLNELEKIIITLAHDKCIFVENSKSKLQASTIAKVLAVQTAISGRKVLLCDNFERAQLEREDQTFFNLKDISLAKTKIGLDLLQTDEKDSGVSFFASPNFSENMSSLLSSYDQVIVTAKQEKSASALLAIKEFNPAVLLAAQTRRTKIPNLRKTKEIHPIKVLVNV